MSKNLSQIELVAYQIEAELTDVISIITSARERAFGGGTQCDKRLERAEIMLRRMKTRIRTVRKAREHHSAKYHEPPPWHEVSNVEPDDDDNRN